MTDRGWFADLSDEEERNPQFPWQPFLQTDGCCLPLRIWFATKAECEDFIRQDVAGRRLLEDA